MVSKFVEFFGPGLGTLGLADRATIGNMSPEFGSTRSSRGPETLRYLEFSGRPTEMIELVDAYAREQGMFWDSDLEEPTFSETLELDLDDVEPSIAGPSVPQDRSRSSMPTRCSSNRCASTIRKAAEELGNNYDEAVEESFPASDPPAEDRNDDRGRPRHFDRDAATAIAEARADDVVLVTLEDGTEVQLDHGHVVIAAITSCTNTSNPSVMIGAAPRAQGGRARPAEQALGQDLAAPGSTVVTDYLEQAASTSTSTGWASTWSDTAARPASATPRSLRRSPRPSTSNDLVVCSVLSGNRNFEGRIQQDVRNNHQVRRCAWPTRSPGAWTST